MSDYLCEELIVEIFRRLPPKSLLRFRSLSKSWYSCISSPDFIRMHTFRSAQKLLIKQRYYYRNEDEEFEDFYTLHGEDQLPLCPNRGYIGTTLMQFPSTYSVIVGSCKGILCLSDFKERIILWNPSIRRKLTLPDYPCPHSTLLAGFGFDPTTDDYKIVRISMSFPGDGIIERSSFIYTLKTGVWCAIASPTPLFSTVLSEACFVNGSLHWVVERYYIDLHDIDCRYIMTFDLSTHVFGMISFPEPGLIPIGLTKIQGSLALIASRMYYYDDDKTCWIWVRRGASWYVVSKSKENFGQGRLTGVFQPSIKGDLLVKTDGEGVKVYNPKMGEKSRVVGLNTTSYILDIVHCDDSLYLLDKGTACEANQLSISVSGGKETSKTRYSKDIYYYFQILFKPLFNMRRWFTR